MKGFISELRERNVVKVAFVYIIVAWVVVQIADVALPAFEAPAWVLRVFMLFLLLGFPVALILAWALDLTPEGIKRAENHHGNLAVYSLAGLIAAATLLWFLSNGPAVDVVETSETEPAPKLAADERTIAVLPFVNMSPNPEQEYFADGMTEEILNALVKYPDLRVAARTSVFSYKGRNADVRDIGKDLGVYNVLEGSVRREGERLRITAQLVRTNDGFHLWSESYDRNMDNVFEIQEDIATRIAEALQAPLGIGAADNVEPRTVNLAAYDLYLRGQALLRRRGLGLVEALELFQQAVETDPDFAEAWAGLARTYEVLWVYTPPSQHAQFGDTELLGRLAAERAMELNPDIAIAPAALANYQIDALEWESAERGYERALELDPSSADIMEDYVSLLMMLGRHQEAFQIAQQMVALDPLVPVFVWTLAEAYRFNGQIDEARRYHRRALEVDPQFRPSQTVWLQMLIDEGRFDDALAYIEEMDVLEEQMRPILRRSVEIVKDGGRLTSDFINNEIDKLDWDLSFVMVSLTAGDTDAFFEYVEGLDVPGETNWLNTALPTPQLDRHRSDPRMKEFLVEHRLPNYWRKHGWPEYCQPLGEDDFKCE